ncbi:MAG: GntR family transcriptional regulator [Gaiellaceae bacterium]
MSRSAPPTPKYWHVRDAVEQMIRRNGLRPGDRLPTESELGKRFVVSRGTIRRAFDDLEREGVVSREAGRGTFVSERRLVRPLSELTSFTEHLRSLGLEPGAALVSFTSVVGDGGADHFPAGTPLVRIVRVRTAAGEPVGIHTLYLAADVAARIGFTRTVLRRMPELSLYGVLGAAGVEIDVAREDITARLATSRELELLHLSPNAPLLEVVRRTYDADSRPVELVRAAYRADRYDYVIWLRRDLARSQEEVAAT